MKKPLYIISVSLLALFGTAARADHGHSRGSSEPIEATLLVSGLMGSIGGAIGADGALYVPQGALGEITRIDVSNGERSTFASGLPPALIPIGGAIDIAFVGRTAYVLVTLVGDPLFGGGATDGIYRINRDGSTTLLADLGQFSLDNPPPLGSLESPPPAGSFNYFLVHGLQYALQPVNHGFLVSDGHLNRVLRVSRKGDITVLKSFGDVVPTGMATAAGNVYLAQTGPIINDQEIGRLVSFPLHHRHPIAEVAADISMAVDVAVGPRQQLYVLSQGEFGGGDPGAPATPFTGSLLRINEDGTTTVLADELNLPTSLHFVGDTALVVTLTGEVWKFEGVSENGQRHDRCNDCDH